MGPDDFAAGATLEKLSFGQSEAVVGGGGLLVGKDATGRAPIAGGGCAEVLGVEGADGGADCAPGVGTGSEPMNMVPCAAFFVPDAAAGL